MTTLIATAPLDMTTLISFDSIPPAADSIDGGVEGSVFVEVDASDSSHKGTWTGIFTKYDSEGSPQLGTVTEYSESNSDGVMFSITGAKIAVKTLNTFDGDDFVQKVFKLALAGNDAITGSTGNDHLQGFNGNDTLSSGGGIDTLDGGAGNDTYIVSSTIATIIDVKGIDTVQSSVTFTLATLSSIENLTLTGSTTINGTGNALANVITGNVSNNILDGGAGNDRLSGGGGNDIYIIDNKKDAITEVVNAGTDEIQSSVTYTLSINVENLTLTGSAAINGTGNALANVITGNVSNNILNGGAGDDILHGGAGDDKMIGGAGDDALYGEDGNDKIIGGMGNDQLEGEGGNDSLDAGVGDDNLYGWEGNDTLTGGAGNDLMAGEEGNDTLTGGAGNDTFPFSTDLSITTNVDTITDFVSGADTILLYVSVFSAIGPGGYINLSSGDFVSGAGVVAHDTTDHILYDTITGTLSYDADGSDSQAAIQFAILADHPTLVASDLWTI